MNELQKRHKAVNDRAVAIGLQVVKSPHKLHKNRPYILEPIPTRQAHERWGTRYLGQRFWLDEAEAEIDELTNN